MRFVKDELRKAAPDEDRHASSQKSNVFADVIKIGSKFPNVTRITAFSLIILDNSSSSETSAGEFQISTRLEIL